MITTGLWGRLAEEYASSESACAVFTGGRRICAVRADARFARIDDAGGAGETAKAQPGGSILGEWNRGQAGSRAGDGDCLVAAVRGDLQLSLGGCEIFGGLGLA